MNTSSPTSPIATSGCDAPADSQPRVVATVPKTSCGLSEPQLVSRVSAVTSFGWTRGLRQLEASRTVAYLYGVPVVAIVIGALALGESVTLWLGLGGVLVVAGMALAQ